MIGGFKMKDNMFEDEVYKNLDKDNVNEIIAFLESNNCDYIDELLERYLDLFIFDINEFVIKFNKLNNKYNNNYIEYVKDNMDLLNEFYEI